MYVTAYSLLQMCWDDCTQCCQA